MIALRGVLASSAALIALTAAGLPVHAQQAGENPARVQVAQAIEEIVVTARKREESLQDAPLSISAFSSAAIEEKGLRSLQDIAKFSPGVQFNEQALAAPGRYNTSVRFRGMFSEAFRATEQLASVFVDGVFVTSGVSSLGIEDVERVEIIKGPQSALFGRTTFGGAVNFITSKPSLTEYGGKLSASITDRQQFETSASVNGPLVKDVLAFQIAGRYYDKRGHYTSATDGGRLGSQNTKALSGQLYATPVEGLEIRWRGNYFEDSDGSPASVYFRGVDPRFGSICAPGATRAFICGALPKLQESFIELNTQLVPFVRDVLINNSTNSFALRNSPKPNGPGLEREAWRMSLSLDYDIADTGFTFSAITGLSQEKAGWVRDFDQSGNDFWWSADPQYHRIFSQEGRFSYDDGGWFRALVGGNYVKQKFFNSGSGGVALNPPPPIASGLVYPATAFAQDRPETYGIFGSVSVDFFENFTATFEGRYQWDKISTFSPASNLLSEGEFKKFIPRFILQYKPTEDLSLYATYAEGNNPGGIANQIATATPAVRAQIASALGVTSELIPEETIKNYEAGVKGTFLDGRAQANLSGYFMKWGNQRSTVALRVDDPTAVGGARFLNISLPIGTTELWGVEADFQVVPTDGLTVGVTFNWAASEYTNFPNAGFAQFIGGTNDLTGRKTPNFPEFSGTLSLNYTQPFSDAWDWFVGGELIYAGKQYTDQANLSWIRSNVKANLRAGFENEQFRVEAFVTNLTNNKTYPSGYRWSDFARAPSVVTFSGQFQGVVAALPDKRQFGLRASFTF